MFLTTLYQEIEITRMKLGWGLGSTWWGRELETGLEINLKNEEWRGGVILKLILKNFNRMAWTGFIWLGIEKDMGCHEQGNVPSVSVKGW